MHAEFALLRFMFANQLNFQGAVILAQFGLVSLLDKVAHSTVDEFVDVNVIYRV